LGIAAAICNMGVVFWVFGVGAWTPSMPVQLSLLDVRMGQESSGGIVFKFNIKLGIWVTVVLLCQLAIENGIGKA
jgi:hypothetical protein